MNKYELAVQIAKQVSGITQKQSEEMLHALVSTLLNTLKTGGKVSLTGFGTFSVKHRVPRKGINPQTKQKIQISAIKTAKFKPGKVLKETLKATS